MLFCLLAHMAWVNQLPLQQKRCLDQEKLAKAIKEHIEKNMPWPADSVRIELISSLPEIAEVKGKLSFKVESRAKEDYLGDTPLL